jgi:hypothetical protein
MIGLGLATAGRAQIPCTQPPYLGGFIIAPENHGGGALSGKRPVQGPENADAGETLSVQTSQDSITSQSITASGGSAQKTAGPVSLGDAFQWLGGVPATGSRRSLRLKAA